MNVTFVVAVVLFVSGAFYWAISRFCPRGTVLFVAAVFYGLGVLLGQSGLDGGRVMSLASGVLKMSGFLGGILGFLDLVRKREPDIIEAEIAEPPDTFK